LVVLERLVADAALVVVEVLLVQRGSEALRPGRTTPPLQHEIRGQAVEPGQRALVQGLEACSPLEGDSKRLGREFVRAVLPDSPLEVVVNRGEVAVEEDAEQLRLR